MTVSPLEEGASQEASSSEQARAEESISEQTSSRSLSSPVKPTERMVEDHNVSHIPFRSWCAHCVRGQAKSIGHVRHNKQEEQIPTVCMDYGFLGSEGDGGSDHEHPVLVMVDRASKMKGSFPVPCKGIAHPYPAKIVTTFLNKLGYTKVILKSDQEPSIVALGRAVKAQWEGEIMLEYSPKGESKSNGEAERAVQSVHGLARTVKDFLEEKLQISLEPTWPILAWLIEYSATLQNIFQIGSDGMTAFHRLKGKPWRVDLPSFGECVEFKKRTGSKLESRWESGIYLGVKDTTTERVVGMSRGSS